MRCPPTHLDEANRNQQEHDSKGDKFKELTADYQR